MAVCGVVAVWDTGGEFFGLLRKALPQLPFCRAELAPPGRVALLVLAPEAGPPIELPPCRALLIPGHRANFAGKLDADWAVSYGLSPKNTLTLSAWNPTTASLTLQRTLTTLPGTPLLPQDFVVHHSPMSPLTLLGIAGTGLVWGCFSSNLH